MDPTGSPSPDPMERGHEFAQLEFGLGAFPDHAHEPALGEIRLPPAMWAGAGGADGVVPALSATNLWGVQLQPPSFASDHFPALTPTTSNTSVPLLSASLSHPPAPSPMVPDMAGFPMPLQREDSGTNPLVFLSGSLSGSMGAQPLPAVATLAPSLSTPPQLRAPTGQSVPLMAGFGASREVFGAKLEMPSLSIATTTPSAPVAVTPPFSSTSTTTTTTTTHTIMPPRDEGLARELAAMAASPDCAAVYVFLQQLKDVLGIKVFFPGLLESALVSPVQVMTFLGELHEPLMRALGVPIAPPPSTPQTTEEIAARQSEWCAMLARTMTLCPTVRWDSEVETKPRALYKLDASVLQRAYITLKPVERLLLLSLLCEWVATVVPLIASVCGSLLPPFLLAGSDRRGANYWYLSSGPFTGRIYREMPNVMASLGRRETPLIGIRTQLQREQEPRWGEHDWQLQTNRVEDVDRFAASLEGPEYTFFNPSVQDIEGYPLTLRMTWVRNPAPVPPVQPVKSHVSLSEIEDGPNRDAGLRAFEASMDRERALRKFIITQLVPRGRKPAAKKKSAKRETVSPTLLPGGDGADEVPAAKRARLENGSATNGASPHNGLGDASPASSSIQSPVMSPQFPNLAYDTPGSPNGNGRGRGAANRRGRTGRGRGATSGPPMVAQPLVQSTEEQWLLYFAAMQALSAAGCADMANVSGADLSACGCAEVDVNGLKRWMIEQRLWRMKLAAGSESLPAVATRIAQLDAVGFVWDVRTAKSRPVRRDT